MQTGQPWRLGHRVALDGVRGIAILFVLVAHLGVPGTGSTGPVGVTLFFTLSGFLITALLIEEHATSGRISLNRFYIRRLRRLFPALAVSMAVITAIGVAGQNPLVFTWKHLAAVGLYIGNWIETAPGAGNLGLMAGTWSLAVEEQFYLIWPLAVTLCLRLGGPRLVARASALGVAASVLDQWWLFEHGAITDRLYYGTDTSAAALLIGATLGVSMHTGATSRPRPRIPSAIAALCLVPTAYFAFPWLTPCVALVSAVLLWLVCSGAPTPAWLSSTLLVWVGRRSYGIYLWNCPIAIMLDMISTPWWARLVLLFGGSFGLAALSWRFVERPFIRSRSEVTQLDTQRSEPNAQPLSCGLWQSRRSLGKRPSRRFGSAAWTSGTQVE